MVIQWKWFCRLIGVNGIMLFPFCFVNDKSNKVLVNHERIHFRQAIELWVLGFYLLYMVDYLRQRRKYKHLHPSIRHTFAYRGIIFEKEAFENQFNLDYLKERKRKAYKEYK
jgi:hypothetical protein